MPTFDEVKELVKECEWESASYNNKSGYLLKGPNGNYLFIVTVSCTHTNSSKLAYSQFWTSTNADGCYDVNDSAYYLNYSYFNASNTFMAQETLKYYGLPIRPICDYE
jgi:hypothetical protein